LVAERLDAVGNTRFRREGADDAEHLALRAMFRQRQQLQMILFSKVRREHHERCQVKLAVSHLAKDDSKPSRDSGSAGAAVGGVFAEAKLVDTICVEARACSKSMDASRFDFGEMSQEGRQQLVRASDQTARVGE
jgi:hypothetical protein